MTTGDILMRNLNERYDFYAIGQAIKAARKSKGWTREQVAEMVGLAPRYLMSIENSGQHPSFQVFYELVKLFNISADQYIFPNEAVERSTQRRQLNCLLDMLTEKDLLILKATANGIVEARKSDEVD